MNKQLQNEATAFFDAFVAAFGTFDGKVVAQLFTCPYLAMDAEGNSNVFLTSADIADYFQKYLNSYQSDGCKSCSFHNLEAVAIGTKNALLTVTWKLLRSNGVEVSSWRESYNVVRTNNQLQAYASVDHAT